MRWQERTTPPVGSLGAEEPLWIRLSAGRSCTRGSPVRSIGTEGKVGAGARSGQRYVELRVDILSPISTKRWIRGGGLARARLLRVPGFEFAQRAGRYLRGRRAGSITCASRDRCDLRSARRLYLEPDDRPAVTRPSKTVATPKGTARRRPLRSSYPFPVTPHSIPSLLTALLSAQHPPRQLVRNAISGSTRDARRAGT